MTNDKRNAFHQQVVEALIESKAVNIAAIGTTFAKFGERAALNGETLVQVVNGRMLWCCGWPGPELDVLREGISREGR